MAIPVSFYGETINDNTLKSNGEPESASWSVPVTTLTAANLVATRTLISNLSTAVGGLIIGILASAETVVDRQKTGSGPAASHLAQRENKFLVRFHDPSTLVKYRVSLPTADLSALLPNSEFVDVTASAGLALKTAWELVVVSPANSAQLTILDSIQFVGRNT